MDLLWLSIELLTDQTLIQFIQTSKGCTAQALIAWTCNAVLSNKHCCDWLFQSTAKPADWRYQSGVCSCWATVSCCLEVDLLLALPENRTSTESMEKCLQVSTHSHTADKGIVHPFWKKWSFFLSFFFLLFSPFFSLHCVSSKMLTDREEIYSSHPNVHK